MNLYFATRNVYPRLLNYQIRSLSSIPNDRHHGDQLGGTQGKSKMLNSTKLQSRVRIHLLRHDAFVTEADD